MRAANASRWLVAQNATPQRFMYIFGTIQWPLSMTDSSSARSAGRKTLLWKSSDATAPRVIRIPKHGGWRSRSADGSRRTARSRVLVLPFLLIIIHDGSQPILESLLRVA